MIEEDIADNITIATTLDNVMEEGDVRDIDKDEFNNDNIEG